MIFQSKVFNKVNANCCIKQSLFCPLLSGLLEDKGQINGTDCFRVCAAYPRRAGRGCRIPAVPGWWQHSALTARPRRTPQ